MTGRGRHGFFNGGGGRIVDRWPTYPKNTLKIGKDTGFGLFSSRIWGDVPSNFFHCGDASPPSPRFRRPW